MLFKAKVKHMDERYDIAIIGTGPAGLSAALNVKIRNKKYILFGNSILSNKVEKAHTINNYLGFPGIQGKTLVEEFQKHLREMDIQITEKKVTNIYSMGDYFSILANNELYEAKSLILATGVQLGKSFPGEEMFLGKGVSYCATCDGMLFRNKTVAVVAYEKHNEAEAEYLAGLASKVYYIPMYKDDIKLSEKIEIVMDKPTEILGEGIVEKLVLKNKTIETDGIFILRDTISPNTLLPGIETEENHIKVDRTMKTSLAGCFAAGDIVGKPYQYIKAAGEGNVASLSAVNYIEATK
jgi:thioredoxin reductase (NADPH)